ncbi:MAG: CBS domain-containing protein [Candidatus Micrarchaeota archaeon]|nr:CBS domain-containing protein [Candidatus Micrarchaeota archaeon]
MKVKEIMRKDFVYFQADAKMDFIVRTLAQKGISSAPVFDRGEFLGILGEKDLLRYFSPAHFPFLWIKDKPSPIEKMKSVTASDLCHKPAFVLKPEDRLDESLSKIASATECIPVIDDGKVVGLLRSEDILNFFLMELAKGDFSSIKASEEDSQKMGSAMDEILRIVRKENEVSVKRISSELGLSFKTAEKLCEILARHHLIEMHYSLLKGPLISALGIGPIVKASENSKK